MSLKQYLWGIQTNKKQFEKNCDILNQNTFQSLKLNLCDLQSKNLSIFVWPSFKIFNCANIFNRFFPPRTLTKYSDF